jgi:hypothetical protein
MKLERKPFMTIVGTGRSVFGLSCHQDKPLVSVKRMIFFSGRYSPWSLSLLEGSDNRRFG